MGYSIPYSGPKSIIIPLKINKLLNEHTLVIIEHFNNVAKIWNNHNNKLTWEQLFPIMSPGWRLLARDLSRDDRSHHTCCLPPCWSCWTCVRECLWDASVHSGLAEGTIRKKWIFTKTAVIYHILPSWGHWWLYKSISGEILTNFLVNNMFVAQKLADLEHFKDCRHE